ncbi:hypothetical protein BDV93DRAFT_515402 [Ceratobasidium sp. AG-I]|nr:hypothetical protein BDV93DRAFT_515402 [Ceratobasidium sp. AG-I]
MPTDQEMLSAPKATLSQHEASFGPAMFEQTGGIGLETLLQRNEELDADKLNHKALFMGLNMWIFLLGDHVKANTVSVWARPIIYCIAHFTYNPVLKFKCGHEVLTNRLYSKIICTVKDLIVRDKLNHHTSVKYISYGKMNLSLLLSTQSHHHIIVSNNTTTPEWLTNLTNTFTKAGSTSTTCNLIRVGVFCIWSTLVHQFETIEELINCEEYRLVITKPNEQFGYLNVQNGGVDFVHSPQAGTTHVFGAVSIFLTSVGFQGSTYGFRRGTATKLDTRLGTALAGLVVKYQDSTTVVA